MGKRIAWKCTDTGIFSGAGNSAKQIKVLATAEVASIHGSAREVLGFQPAADSMWSVPELWEAAQFLTEIARYTTTGCAHVQPPRNGEIKSILRERDGDNEDWLFGPGTSADCMHPEYDIHADIDRRYGHSERSEALVSPY
jgi:hypothetical protein